MGGRWLPVLLEAQNDFLDVGAGRCQLSGQMRECGHLPNRVGAGGRRNTVKLEFTRAKGRPVRETSKSSAVTRCYGTSPAGHSGADVSELPRIYLSKTR